MLLRLVKEKLLWNARPGPSTETPPKMPYFWYSCRADDEEVTYDDVNNFTAQPLHRSAAPK
jgi:hypothetical protein